VCFLHSESSSMFIFRKDRTMTFYLALILDTLVLAKICGNWLTRCLLRLELLSTDRLSVTRRLDRLGKFIDGRIEPEALLKSRNQNNIVPLAPHKFSVTVYNKQSKSLGAKMLLSAFSVFMQLLLNVFYTQDGG
jgi:hypothetical protein